MKNKTEKMISILLIWLPTIFFIFKSSVLAHNISKIEMILMSTVISLFAFFCIVIAAQLRKNKKIPKILYYVICLSIPLYFSIDQFKIIFQYNSWLGLITGHNNVWVGILIVVIGNYFPKMQFNKFIGLKFWWLKNRQDIWKKAHLLAGYLWVIAGILMIMVQTPNSTLCIGIYFLLLYFIPLVYAAFLYLFVENKVKH